MVLNEQGRTSEAIASLRLAVEFGNRRDAAIYGSELIDILTAAGRTRELDEIREVIKKKSK